MGQNSAASPISNSTSYITKLTFLRTSNSHSQSTSPASSRHCYLAARCRKLATQHRNRKIPRGNLPLSHPNQSCLCQLAQHGQERRRISPARLSTNSRPPRQRQRRLKNGYSRRLDFRTLSHSQRDFCLFVRSSPHPPQQHTASPRINRIPSPQTNR